MINTLSSSNNAFSDYKYFIFFFFKKKLFYIEINENFLTFQAFFLRSFIEKNIYY